MGLFGRSVNNAFDELFDINRDGTLDAAEEAMQFDFMDRMSRNDFGGSDDDDEDEFAEDDFDADEYDDDFDDDGEF